MQWIWNKKQYSPVLFLGSVAMKCLNGFILIFILDMFFRVWVAKKSSWYDVVTGETQETDRFFMEKADMIFFTLSFVIVLLLFFCGVVLWLFSKQQAERNRREIGMFLVSGYTDRQVFGILFADSMMDMIVGMGIGSGFFGVAVNLVMKNEIFQSFYQITAENHMTQILAFVFAIVFFVFIIAAQAFVWLKKTEKNGISMMLKEK